MRISTEQVRDILLDQTYNFINTHRHCMNLGEMQTLAKFVQDHEGEITRRVNGLI